MRILALESDNPFMATESIDSVRLPAEPQSPETQRLALQTRELLQEAQLDPLKLASLIESRQTPVYRLRRGWLLRWVFCLLKVHTGFMPMPNGLKGSLLRLMLRLFAERPAKSAARQAEAEVQQGLFILTPALFTTGFMAYQLHHWVAFQSGLGGYCNKAQRLYERFWTEHKGVLTSESVHDWTEEDVIALRAAIRQEVNALEFFRTLMQDVLFLTQPAAATFETSKGQ
jgi:hypothetical protein